jgi:hypothetical protein
MKENTVSQANSGKETKNRDASKQEEMDNNQ